MGITVVTSTALNAASANPAAGLPGETLASGEFASLLEQQLLGTAALSVQGQQASVTEEERESIVSEEPASANDGTAALPFLLAGIETRPQPTPSAESQSPIASVVSNVSSSKASEIALPSATLPQAESTASAEDSILGSGNTAAEAAKFAVPLPAASDNAGNSAALTSQASALGQQAAPVTFPAPPAPRAPVGNSSWSRDFGDSVVWMSRQQVQSAQINLNPPQLGPVQVTLNVVGDQATAVFASPHAEVRQAITDAMPQLREMLAGAGINLGQANVGAQLQQQAQQNAPQPSGSGRFASDNAILQGTSAVEDAAAPSLVSRGRGLVDLFA